MIRHLPGVSVLMPTYARTGVLREAVHSFLTQTYQGPKELVILNDRVDQTLVFNHPTVWIQNQRLRYTDLGSKRNALARLATYDLICYWDDDDVYLPERLARGVNLYLAREHQGFRVSRESHCFQTDDNVTLQVLDSGHFWTAVLEKKALEDVGGFPPLERRQDVEAFRKLVLKGWVYGETATPGLPSCIHRNGGTGYVRVSDAQTFENAEVRRTIDAGTVRVIATGVEPTGIVPIVPGWTKDYLAMAQAVWDTRS